MQAILHSQEKQLSGLGGKCPRKACLPSSMKRAGSDYNSSSLWNKEITSFPPKSSFSLYCFTLAIRYSLSVSKKAGQCHGPTHAVFQAHQHWRWEINKVFMVPKAVGAILYRSIAGIVTDIQGHFSSKRGRARPPIQPQLKSLQMWVGIYSIHSLSSITVKDKAQKTSFPGDMIRIKCITTLCTFIYSTLTNIN